jgi:phage-related minor tail protein
MTIENLNVQVSADISAFNEGMTRAADTAGKFGDQLGQMASVSQQSTGKMSESMRAFNDQVKRAATIGDDWKEKVLAQNQAMSAVTASMDAARDKAYMLANGYKEVGGQLVKVGEDAGNGFGAMAAAADKGAFATVQARRELMVLGHEVMSGNFSRIPGSLMVLAERTNFTVASIFGMGGAITAAVAAVAAFAIAIKMGAVESDAYARALVLTGNAAGETAAGLQVMAGNVAAATSATQHFAAEVLAELASGGKVAADGLQQAAQAAIDLERVGGPAAEETVKQFNELGKSPVEASLKLNDATHFLTESIYLQIKALEDQGNKAAAAALAQTAYASDVEKKADELRASLGSLQRAWLSVKDGAKSAWDAMMNIGRPTTLDEAQANLDKMKQSLGEYQQGNLGRFFAPTQADIDAQQKYIDKMKASSAAEAAAATVKAESNKQQQAAIAFDQEREKHLDKTARMWREITQAEIEGTQGGKSQAEILNAITEIQSRYADKTKTSAKAAKDSYDSVYGSIAKLNAELMAGSDSQDKMTRAQKLALDTMVGIQNGTIKLTESEKIRVSSMLESALALDKQATAQKAAQAAGEAYRQEMEAEDAARQKANDSLDKEIDKLKTHGEEIGLSKDALDALILSRQDDAIAIAKQTLAKAEESDASAQEIIDLNKTITLLKERRSILESNQWRQSAADAADASAKEWQKGWDETDKLARGVFTDWATQGKNAAQKIGDTLKKALLSAIYEATLKPIAFQVYGSLTGGGGMAGAIAGPGGGIGSMLGMGQQGYSLYSGLTSGNGVFGTVGNWLGMGPAATTGMTTGVAFAPTAASSFGTGAAVSGESLGVSGLTGVSGEASGSLLSTDLGALYGTGQAAGTAAGATATAGAAEGAAAGLAAIPGWGWAALGVAALLSSGGDLFGGGGDTDRSGNWKGGLGQPTKSTDNHWFSSGEMGTSLDAFSQSLQSNEQSLISSLGLTADQITKINAKLDAVASKQYGFGMEHTDWTKSGAEQAITRDRLQSIADVLGESLNKMLTDATFGMVKIRAEFAAAGKETPKILEAIAGSFDALNATTETTKAALDQFNDALTVTQYTMTDPLHAVMDQIAQNASGATGALQRNSDALMAMISTYDGSAAATKNLAAATQGQYQLEMQMIQQIQSALSATHSMYTDSIESIKMSVMDNPAKYDYLRTQADTIYQQLAKAIDPAQIQNLASKINADVNSAYGMLDAKQQKDVSGEFIAYLTKVDDLTTKRLNASQDAITKEHNDLAAKLTAKMDEAAAQLNAAAAALQVAAAKPTPPAHVTIFNALQNAEVSVS